MRRNDVFLKQTEAGIHGDEGAKVSGLHGGQVGGTWLHCHCPPEAEDLDSAA